MTESDLQPATPALRPWAAPRLAALDISLTSAGPSPNIQETVLTDTSFPIS